MSTNDGGAAFPFVTQSNGWWEDMTLRDYFAAKALDSCLNYEGFTSYQQCAEKAYNIADAMLAERAKGNA
jgi:hypothetical protein